MRNKSIVKSSIVITVLMLIFKVLGFVKQAVIAYYFGVSSTTDTYFIAWGFVSGVSDTIVKSLSVSLLPIYTMFFLSEGKNRAAELINGLIQLLFPILIFLALMIYIFSPIIARALAPTYIGNSKAMLIEYTRILAPIVLFTGVEFVITTVLDAHKSFYIPRMQSLIYSLSVITCTVLLSGKIGIKALILGQYITKVLFLILLIYFVKKYHHFFYVKINEIEGIKKIFITALPLFLGNSVFYFNTMVDKAISSGLGNGAASILSYSQIIEQFVSSIIIGNIGGIIFVSFAENAAKKDKAQVLESLYSAINIMVVILTAVTVMAVISSRDIVSIVYLRGNFSYDAMLSAATVLVGYIISFIPVTIRDFVAKGLYAFQDTYKTMISSIICITINIVFSIGLSKVFGLLGVTIATSIARTIGMIINVYFLKKELPNYKFSKHMNVFIKCIPGAILLAFWATAIEKSQLWNAYIRFGVITLVGGFIYLLICWFCRVKEVETMVKMVKGIINKH